MLSEVISMSKYWTEDRKQRVVDYLSGMIFGYCLGMIVGVWILWDVGDVVETT